MGGFTPPTAPGSCLRRPPAHTLARLVCARSFAEGRCSWVRRCRCLADSEVASALLKGHGSCVLTERAAAHVVDALPYVWPLGGRAQRLVHHILRVARSQKASMRAAKRALPARSTPFGSEPFKKRRVCNNMAHLNKHFSLGSAMKSWCLFCERGGHGRHAVDPHGNVAGAVQPSRGTDSAAALVRSRRGGQVGRPPRLLIRRARAPLQIRGRRAALALDYRRKPRGAGSEKAGLLACMGRLDDIGVGEPGLGRQGRRR